MVAQLTNSICGCDGIGIRVGLRSQILWVRVPPSAPVLMEWSHNGIGADC
jgi:hypothetical protein